MSHAISFGNENQPGTPLGYVDEHGVTRKLGIDEWRFPTSGSFELLYNVAKLAGAEVASFRKRIATVSVNLSAGELAQAEKGTASLQTLMRERRAAAEKQLALEVLKTLAQYEHGLTHETDGSSITCRIPVHLYPSDGEVVVDVHVSIEDQADEKLSLHAVPGVNVLADVGSAADFAA